MTVNEYLKSATTQLQAAGIGTARLDALVLLEDTCAIDRAALLAEPGRQLTASQQAQLTKLLKRRTRHEPLAYIRGFTEFYGRRFVITPAVLEPRPESETMIELLLTLVRAQYPESIGRPQSPKTSQSLRIADVGTGSGALGITAQLELPGSLVELLEISGPALQVAQINVDLLTPTISVIKSDLVAHSTQGYDVLLCNLPYVPDDYRINEAAAQEPRIAIFGGPDGLSLYRRLFEQLQECRKQPLFILTESLPSQHLALQAIAGSVGYQLKQTKDFIQVFCPA